MGFMMMVVEDQEEFDGKTLNMMCQHMPCGIYDPINLLLMDIIESSI